MRYVFKRRRRRRRGVVARARCGRHRGRFHVETRRISHAIGVTDADGCEEERLGGWTINCLIDLIDFQRPCSAIGNRRPPMRD